MSPIQQMLLGVGAVATKTYLDDIFSTFLYKGTGSAQSINNGIDLSSEGGMVWIKQRTGQFTNSNFLFDTKRGTGKYVKSDSSATEDTSNLTLSAFNSNGFSVGSSSTVNLDFSSYQGTYNSWSFRKAPGFLDIIEWSGNGANRLINHNLGSVPGMVAVKCTSHSQNWQIWHKAFGYTHSFSFNRDAMPDTGASSTWNSTDPTATQISVGPSVVNASGRDYIAYVFAGGESTAATARSVDFDGSGDYLSIADSSDFEIDGTNFTLECWFKADDLSGGQAIAGQWQSGGGTQRNFDFYLSGSTLYFENCRGSTNYSISTTVSVGQWYHIAGVLDGTTLKLFVNGNLVGTTTVSGSANNSTANFGIGGYATGTAEEFNGKISNVRFVKGTAVYTSSFRPSTEPLTNITNTKLLCCNNSSTTGSTVTPGTITANGDPTASTDSPFDDPAGFSFGDSGDQNVIKTGSYVGSGTVGLEVNVGFEPQWVLFKNASATYNWYVLDVMRGLVSGGDDRILTANGDSQEWDSSYIEVTPTGFKIETSHPLANGSGNTYIYMCLRRPDGYVGKPPELGTDVFNMVMGTSNSDVPAFVSGFVTDFAFNRGSAITEDWWTQSRLTGDKYLRANTTAAQGTSTPNKWDYNNGWYAATSNQSAYQSWMWKRHAGFDVVTFEGTNVAGLQIQHNLGKTPEMIWIKNRDASENWSVYHKGLNGGSNQGHFAINLNHNYAEIDTDGYWNDTAPTATAFTVGNNGAANGNEMSMLAMLFASVSGISAVGSYTGNGNSTSGITVTTGFQLRFLIIKRADGTGPWYVVDSLRGMSNSGDEKLLKLNTSDPQVSDNIGNTSSTGFTITSTHDTLNGNGDKYIYYAHA
jgi:hypothetical protein